MKAARILSSAVVLFLALLVLLALFALVAMWRHEWLGLNDTVIFHAIGSSLSAIVLIPAALILAGYLCPAKRDTKLASRKAADYAADYDKIPDPYPASYKSESITGFRYDSPLHLMRLEKRLSDIGPEQQYIVAEDYTVYYSLMNGEGEPVTVPKGMLTDLASVPRFFRWYVGRVGPHLEASIIHDYLYIAWQLTTDNGFPKPTREMRRFADDLMLVAMQEAGMGCKSRLIYRAIRCFGKGMFFGPNPEPLILDLDRLLNEGSSEQRAVSREELEGSA